MKKLDEIYGTKQYNVWKNGRPVQGQVKISNIILVGSRRLGDSHLNMQANLDDPVPDDLFMVEEQDE